MDGEVAFGVFDAKHGVVGEKLDAGVFCRGTEGGGELAGVDGVLVEKGEMRTCEVVGREKDVEVGAGKGGDGGQGGGLKGEVGLKGNADVGEVGDVIEEGGVETEGEIGERLEEGRVGGVVVGEHAGGGGGGFGEEGAAVEKSDARSATGELEREGEADDAGASDTHVGVLHRASLEEVEKGGEARGSAGFIVGYDAGVMRGLIATKHMSLKC